MEFNCPHCHVEIECQPEDAGRDSVCPDCERDLTIPSAPELTGIIEQTISKIEASGKTISVFAREHNLPGGDVQLGSDMAGRTESEHDRKYRIGEQIARGGMGAVLDAHDLNLRRRVAMKVMLNPDHVSESAMARFIEEAQVTGQLEHPGIVPVYELGIDAQNRPFYAMKLLRGQTLEDILKKLKAGDPATAEAWPLSRLVTAFVRVCEALRYAHAKGVIHRDLKPENIMVGAFGEVQVLDWGLAKILGRPQGDPTGNAADPQLEAVESVRTDEGSDAFRSMDGTVAGTPNYMAPEQAAGKIHELDQRTDIYALGAILYQILSLERAVNGPSVHAVLKKVRRGDIPPLAKQDASKLAHLPGRRLPPALCAIATKALARKPADRYPEIGALLTDIEAYQNGFATEAEHAGALRQAALFLRRHKVFAIASTLVLGAILAGSALALVQRNRAVSALEDKEAAEQARAADQTASAPAILQLAEEAVQEGRLEEGERLARLARDFRPEDDAAAALLAGIACIRTNAPAALMELQGRSALDALADSIRDWGDTLGEDDRSALANRFTREHELPMVGAQLAGAPKQRLAMWRAQIEKDWPGYGELLRFEQGDLTFSVSPKIKDLERLRALMAPTQLEPLRGIPLVRFSWHEHTGWAIHDIDALAKTKTLTYFYFGASGPGARLASIEALRGKRLEHVNLGSTHVSDLSPLEGQPIRFFRYRGCTTAENPRPGTMVHTLEPLRDAPLEEFYLALNKILESLEPLRGAPIKNAEFSWVGELDLSDLPGKMDKLVLGAATSRMVRSGATPRQVASVSLVSTHVEQWGPWLKDWRPEHLHFNVMQEKRRPLPVLLDCSSLETFTFQNPRKICLETKAFEDAIVAEDWVAAQKEADRMRESGEAIPGLAAYPEVLAQAANTVAVYTKTPFSPREQDLGQRKGHPSTYWIVPAYADWETARDFAERVGGQLAQAETEAEYEWMRETLNSTYPPDPRTFLALVGASRSEPGEPFRWLTGDEVIQIDKNGGKSAAVIQYTGLYKAKMDERERFIVEWPGPVPEELGVIKQ